MGKLAKNHPCRQNPQKTTRPLPLWDGVFQYIAHVLRYFEYVLNMNIFYTVTCHIVCPRYVPGFLWGEEISRDRSAKGLSAALWHPVFSFFQPFTVYMMQIESSSPRRYPSGFGMALLNGYLKSCQGEFRRDLRKKFELDPSMSDREIFNRYPLLADQWMDAPLPEIFFYHLLPIWLQPLGYSRFMA